MANNESTYGQLTGSDAEFKAARSELIDGLIAALTERFSNVNEGVIRASRVVKFCTWPTDISELQG